LALAAVALVLGCEQHGEPAKIGEDGSAAVAGGPLGKVATVRSALGGIEGMTASGTAGERNLSAGDPIASGEAIQSREGLEGTVVLADGTAVVLHEKTTVTFDGSAQAPALALDRGEISISRFPVSGSGLELRVGDSRFNVITGRTTARLDEQGGAVSVTAGETVFTTGGGDRLLTGDAIRLDAKGGSSREAAPRLAYLPPSDWVEPLAPRFLPPPPVADVLRGIGTLTARAPGSGRKSETALDLTAHTISVSIRDGVALTRIEEAFHNKSNRTVEGTYRFVLPSRASITRLALDVNGVIEEGEVLEKKRAARIFKTVVEDSVRPRDPALLEWKQGSTFTMKIFPIKAGETRRVFISYMEPMTASSGYLRYVYPLGGAGGEVTVGRFSFEAEIETPLGFRQVRAPLYPATVTAEGSRAAVAFEAEGFRPSTDFVVEYAPRDEPGEMRVATQTEKSGESYAMMLLRPPAESAIKPPGSRVIVIIDTSYGITDDLRGLSSAVAVELLASLDREDTFTVLACDSGCRAMTRGFESPSADALGRTHEFLAGIEPGGASDLLGALTQAFSMSRGASGPTDVIYVGDGVSTAGETDPGRLVRLLERTRPAGVAVHTVGIGPDVDALLLDALAEALGGSSYQLSVGESPAVAAYDLARSVQSPGLRNVTVEWPPGLSEAYPQRIGFVPDGGEVAVTARLDRTRVDGEVVVRGTAADGRLVERRYPLSLTAAAPGPGFISRLWAKRHIDALTLNGGAAGEIIDVSRRMRVASRLTSWIVLENQRMYDRFRVQRTDAESWDGEGASFDEVPAEAQAQIAADVDEEEPLDALGYLSDGDFADDAAGVGIGAIVGGSIGSGSATGADQSTRGRDEAPFQQPRPSGKAAAAQAATPPMAAADPWRESEEKAEESAHAEMDKAKAVASKEPAAKPSPYGGELGDLIASGPLKKDAKGGGGGGLGTSYSRPRECGYRTTYDVRITPGRPSASAQAQQNVAQYAALVRQNPLSRKNHKNLVRQLARLGQVEQARAAAEEWRTADPLGTDALTYLADQIARSGDRYRAMRTYASIAELEPGKAASHRRLGEAFRDLGQFAAAAGHFRAAAALEHKPDDEFDFLYCAAAAGWLPLLDVEAQSALGDRRNRKIRGDVEGLLSGARQGLLPAPPGQGKASGELTVRAVVDQPGAEVDLAVIDPAGRRVSGLWRRGAAIADLSSAGEETLALRSLINGTYQIVVTGVASRSASGAPAAAPVSGKVSIRARDKRRTIPFTVYGGEVVLARVKYKKSKNRWECW